MGTDHLSRRDVTLPALRLGSDYGGWTLSLDLLKRVPRPTVYSVGLGHDISFDRALADNLSCEIFGFDPTPKTKTWISRQSLPAGFRYIPLGIADCDGAIDFGVPTDDSFDDFSMARADSGAVVRCEVRRLATLAKELGHSRIDVLKMDIEGAEYAVIDDICRGSLLPIQMLVEFHHRIDGATIIDTRRAIERLRGVGYRLFDVSPGGRELAFVRADQLQA